MIERIVNVDDIEQFEKYLIAEEKSTATIEKYIRDVSAFADFSKSRKIEKTMVMEYKAELGNVYAATSANSMIAALNSFFKFKGWQDCCVKQFRVHKQLYCPEEKELTKAEFYRLINAAKLNGDKRMDMIIQTIGGTGIRVSELRFITVETVEKGEAVVTCKGRTRTVFIVTKLQKRLKRYIENEGISEGPVFISRNGKPMNRCNIWREMKKLCRDAGICESKVFPHNLRHLFARIFYAMEKDIAKLADILGHASIETTRIYIITTVQEHRKRMEAMHLIL